MDIKQEVLQAAERIREHIRRTPLEHSPYLSQISGANVYLKCENLQLTHSFKLRGALNKILSLSEEEKQRGVVTASSGNHGSAVAYILHKFKIDGVVYLPENVSPAKEETLKLYGVQVQHFGTDCVKTEEYAGHEAARCNQIFISPYNDMLIIAGQGTVAVELAQQLKQIDAVFVPVGGGGLISGIGGYLKSGDDKTEIIGCQPVNSAVMYQSIRAGHIVDVPSKQTISDGTAGGIEAGSITFDFCRQVVDNFILVTEAEIVSAIRLILQKQYMLAEGAGVLSIASFLQQQEKYRGKNVVLVISGAKLSTEKLREILNKSLPSSNKVNF